MPNRRPQSALGAAHSCDSKWVFCWGTGTNWLCVCAEATPVTPNPRAPTANRFFLRSLNIPRILSEFPPPRLARSAGGDLRGDMEQVSLKADGSDSGCRLGSNAGILPALTLFTYFSSPSPSLRIQPVFLVLPGSRIRDMATKVVCDSCALPAQSLRLKCFKDRMAQVAPSTKLVFFQVRSNVAYVVALRCLE